MEALIRSAELASFRTRLSELRITRPAAVGRAGAPGMQTLNEPTTAKQKEAALRAEIEEELRAEMAAYVQELYDTERENARVEGYAAGMAEAKDAAAEDLTEVRGRLEGQVQSALSALEHAHQAALASLQNVVGEVAFAALCRVATQKAASQEFVLGIVEQTCAQLRAETHVTARLHPRDVETLQELLEGRELRVQALALTLVADESMALGGCVVEAPSGHYDGGLESQLRRLHAVLCGARDEPAAQHSPGAQAA